nr:vitelline membrane outer layer protein 1-like isoform X1 [Misgurnus anguillicaudatus]
MTSEMSKFSVLLLSLLVVCDQSSGFRPYQSILQVQNGMSWGTWRQQDMCPTGMYAAGFSLKVERSVGDADDTALNGIRLHCIYPSKDSSAPQKSYATVQSEAGSWGEWTYLQWCSHGFLTSFQLKVEPNQGKGDDTAVNNIRFVCSNADILEGPGMNWGDWGDWSPKCQGKGICGIMTRVEPPQGNGDDTALNNVQMYCCN